MYSGREKKTKPTKKIRDHDIRRSAQLTDDDELYGPVRLYKHNAPPSDNWDRHILNCGPRNLVSGVLAHWGRTVG